MRPYQCFYNSRTTEVYANSSYEAQTLAAKIFKVKPKLQYKISVMLADVSHDGAEL